LASPPNIGILSASLASRDLDTDIEHLMSLGAVLIARTTAELPGFGRCDLATVFGPDGEQLEVFQSLK